MEKYFKRICDGTSDLVPGISGGTIALLLGYMMILFHPLVDCFLNGFGQV